MSALLIIAKAIYLGLAAFGAGALVCFIGVMLIIFGGGLTTRSGRK